MESAENAIQHVREQLKTGKVDGIPADEIFAEGNRMFGNLDEPFDARKDEHLLQAIASIKLRMSQPTEQMPAVRIKNPPQPLKLTSAPAPSAGQQGSVKK